MLDEPLQRRFWNAPRSLLNWAQHVPGMMSGRQKNLFMAITIASSKSPAEGSFFQLRSPVDEEGERTRVFIGSGIEKEALAIEADVVIDHSLAISAERRVHGK